jgi:hypothetical protein
MATENRTFDELYCFEKIHDFSRHPTNEVVAALAEWAIETIVDYLGELESKIRLRGLNPDHSEFPEAIHAALELQQYVKKQPCSITSEIEERIYVRSLQADLVELRRWEEQLDSEPLAQRNQAPNNG